LRPPLRNEGTLIAPVVLEPLLGRGRGEKTDGSGRGAAEGSGLDSAGFGVDCPDAFLTRSD
jgi:hypothetical protein